ncbi:MAG: PDDEXK nuclease domain-containing protein [Desulfuromonadales bacterium]
MADKTKPSKIQSAPASGYDAMLSGVVELLEQARRMSARAVNTIMTTTYWDVGRRIVEYEQGGKGRAQYGTQLLERLSVDLGKRFGRGFSIINLRSMRKFYECWPLSRIRQTTSVESEISQEITEIFQTASELSDANIVATFPLPWSQYVRLMTLKSPDARAFYEAESLRGGWTGPQLDRQISTLFYERTALSRNKAAMLKKGQKPLAEDVVTPEEEIKDPLVLEFLGLKDEYSENDLEEALIRHLESFLLELGGDFAFVGRQRRLRIGDSWYRVDLLFFHRRLRCLVVIELKLGKFTHADSGQMHMYLNYAREHWTHTEENPPVGLIICAQKDHALAHYALENLPNKVLAAEYKMVLPDEKALVAEIDKTRKALEMRQLEKNYLR